MMEQPPASLSSPTVSAVNTAAKLQITPEGGLRLVTDKDVLGKEGSANGQAQQQPQQKFFATRTQDGKWNLLMAPTSDPSRLFLVQPTGGQRFQLAPSRPGCVTLRHEVTSAHRTSSSSSSSSSNPANGTASSSKDGGSQGSDDESVVPHHDAVVVPVPQLRATSASLSSIVPPKSSTARRMTSVSKLTSSGKPQVPPAAQKEHLGTAHPAGSKIAAVRVAVSGRDNLKSNSGGKGSKGGTRLALMSSGSKSKIVLVDSATLDKAGGKAGDGGELGLTIAVPTLVVQSFADSPLSKPGKTLSSPSTMADSCRTVPATTTACSTTATITAVTTTTTTVTTVTTTTVTNSSTTDPASLPGLRTRPPAAGCGTWRRSSGAASTAELPSRKKMAESSDSRNATNARVNDDPGEDADVEKTGENLSVNSTKEYNAQCFEKISNGKRVQPNDETSDGGKTSDDESDSADCVPAVAHTKLREEICDEKIDKAGKESAESQENSSKLRDVAKEQLGSDGAVRCAETANEPDVAATQGSGDACEHDGRGVSEQTNLREVGDEEPGQKGKGRKQKKTKQKADESVRRKLRARIRVSDKTSEATSEPSVPQVPARRRETVGVSTKSVPVDNSVDVSEQPPRVSYRAEEKNTPCTSHKAAQSVNETPSRKGAQSESQTPSRKGVQSESQTPSRKGVQSESQTPSRKGAQSENQTPSRKGGQSESQTPSRKGAQSENQTPSSKGGQSESQTPSRKGAQSESQTPSSKGVQSESQTPSRKGAQSENQTPSSKGAQSESQTPSRKGAQLENQTPSSKGVQSESQTPSRKGAQSENETPSSKGAQSVSQTPSLKGAQSESQTPSSKGAQSENQTPSRKEVQSENETPSDKGVQSENETPSDKAVQSENGTPSDEGVQSENQTPSRKEVQSENETPSDKGVQSENETPSDNGVQAENETQSDTGVQSEKETPSGKGVQSKKETPPDNGEQAENQTPSDKESQAENQTLSGKEPSAENETSSDQGLQSQTETSERRMKSEKVTKSRTKALSNKRTNKTLSESETQSKNETPSDKGMQSKTDKLSDEGTQSRSETLMNKGKQLNKKPSQKVPQSKHGTPLEKGTPSGTETPPENITESENETSQKKIQSENPRSSDVALLSTAETPSDKENTLSEKAIPEVLEKAEMYTTAFVVLERLTNRDIAFLCRKFRNARVRSRCSALCRLQTLRHLCSIGAISCEERLLTSSTHRKTSSRAEKLPEAVVSVDDSSSTESCNEDELGKSILRRKRRQKKKPAKDPNAKKSKPSEKLTDLDSPRFMASSVVSSKEPIIIRVSPSSQAGSSVMQNSNPPNQTNLPKPATTRYAVTPAICRALVSTPVPPVQTVPAIPRNAVLLPKPSPVGITDPRNAVMLPKLPSATEGSSVSLKQATRKSLSQAISNSLARKATALSVASDPVSPSIPSVPVTLSSSLSSPRLILATCTSPSAARCLKEVLQSSNVASPASATATPTVRIPASSHPTIKPPPTSATIPTTTTITSAASVQSGKVIVNSGSSVNKQFYLVQIGDKRLLVPITTPTTTTISVTSSSSSSTVPMVVSTSASVPVCLSSVVTSSARSAVLLASKSGGVVSSTALPALRPFSPAPSILQSKNTTASSASKLANRPWSGPRTVASGDNRVILLPVGSVPPLVSGAGEAASSSSLVRRVNIVGSTSSLASLRPVSSTSLLKAVAKSNLVQQNLRPPGPTGKRASTMTEAERLAKRARLEKKYPLPPGVVLKTEPETRGYGDEGVATTAATTTTSTTSNSTCIIRIAASASSTAGVRPGMGTQGIRVGGPFIIRGGTLSAPIFTFVPAVTAAVTSGAVVTSAATAVTAGATAALGSVSESAAASSILGTSVPAVTLAATTVTELTQAEPVASLTTQTSTSFSSSSSSSSPSLSSSSAMLPPPRSQSSSPLVESILLRHASVAVDSSSRGRATPDVTATCAREPSAATPPATAALPAQEPDCVRSSASAPTTAASSPAAPSPCPTSPSPLASLGAMWVRQAADSPDTLPQHVDARSLKGDRVRRLRETLAKQLQDLGDERKQRALQALEKQLCVDD